MVERGVAEQTKWHIHLYVFDEVPYEARLGTLECAELARGWMGGEIDSVHIEFHGRDELFLVRDYKVISVQ